MATNPRPRWVTAAFVAAGALALAACSRTTAQYPSSTFEHTTEFNTAIDYLWDHLLFAGTAVFIFVETFLLYTVFKFRRKPGQGEPKHVHGNTTLEIAWTVIPAVILVFIAVPTVRTIFRTQAKAVSSALQVEVYGHQWWWEFRYPQYGVVTANELYLPKGRTVNFSLRTDDVLHSFWIPRLGGKRDLITNHTNYLWFTPSDSLETEALNGSCNEYCGASHANMKFRAYVVTPEQFASWAAHQASPAVGSTAAVEPMFPDKRTTFTGAQVALAGGLTQVASAGLVATAQAEPAQQRAAQSPAPGAMTPRQAAGAPPSAQATQPVAAAPAGQGPQPGYEFPRADLRGYAVPHTPVPADLHFASNVTANAANGQTAFLLGGCASCHAIAGNPAAQRAGYKIGPDLTHVGSRHTFASALYPLDAGHLRLWIKNAPKMKPGSRMPTLGKGETNPETGVVNSAGLTDQQIADLVAYLQTLK